MLDRIITRLVGELTNRPNEFGVPPEDCTVFFDVAICDDGDPGYVLFVMDPTKPLIYAGVEVTNTEATYLHSLGIPHREELACA